MTLNSILNFIKHFVAWQDKKKPFEFTVLSEHQYKAGLLLRVKRESITSRPNASQIATYVWIPKNKQKPFFYLFLDSLEGRNIRNLSHRIQILSSDRHLTEDSVKVNIYLSESYYLGTHNQANAIALKLILYCRDRNYESVDWQWEIETSRKQILGYGYTEITQDKAREDYRYVLDRLEMRNPAPTSLNPVILEKINIFIEPKVEPPKSRLIEILIIGGILIGIAWLWVSQ